MPSSRAASAKNAANSPSVGSGLGGRGPRWSTYSGRTDRSAPADAVLVDGYGEGEGGGRVQGGDRGDHAEQAGVGCQQVEGVRGHVQEAGGQGPVPAGRGDAQGGAGTPQEDRAEGEGADPGAGE